MDATPNNDWFQWDCNHFDRLPKKVRDAVRKYPFNIDCGKLRKMAKTERDMLTLLEEQKAPL